MSIHGNRPALGDGIRIERRSSMGTRAALQTDGRGNTQIVGYAAVYYRSGDTGTEFELWPGCVERIAPGAFDRALRERQDVIACVNHDSNQLLGRTASGTVRLSTDAIGLRYEIDVDADSTIGADALRAVERGDISGSSFSFLVREENWIDDFAGGEIRELTDLNLVDVSPVVHPAYMSTSATARSSTEGLQSEGAERKRMEFERERIEIQLAMIEMDI